MSCLRFRLLPFRSIHPHIDPNLTKENLMEDIRTREKQIAYGAFNAKHKLCGYAFVHNHGIYAEFLVQKTNPTEEKMA